MNTQQLLASAAAALLTLASVSAINFNVAKQSAYAPSQESIEVVELAAVQVYPAADELRAAALLNKDAGLATSGASDSLSTQNAPSTSFQLLDAQVAMPYYSFDKKFGRASKE